ncbi:MAG: AMP-binding protein [Gammaproteobacteria bacterium]|nr:AMP-binding protein [Gammaproteobacteria bacterium]
MPKPDPSPGAWISRAAHRHARQAALIVAQRVLDYASLYDHLGSLVHGVLDRGFRSGQTIVVITRHRVRLAWAFYLSLYSGCPLLVLDPRRGSLLNLLKEIDVSQAITDQEFVPVLPPSMNRHPSAGLLRHRDCTPVAPSPASAENVHLMVPTGGTTGAVRAVMLSGQNLCAAVHSAQQRIALGPGDVWLACLPLFHIGGLSILLRCLHSGATVLLHERFDPQRICGDLLEHGVTHLSLVPAMLSRLLDQCADAAPAPGLRVVLVGGGPLSWDLASRALGAGWPICPTYGMSETASQVATLHTISKDWQAGDVGTPLQGVDVDIVDEAGCSGTGVGRIRISGPTVMLGYANAQGIDGLGLEAGLFVSNDLGYVDGHRHLHILARADEVLLSGGENVYPQEVEEQLLCCPGIEDVAITARENATWGHYLVALVVGSVSERGFQDWCRDRLPSFQRPRELIRIAKLPRNGLGKLDRRRLKQYASCA